MSKADILRIIQENRQLLSELKIRHVSLFGSYARGEEDQESDVDLLVEFDSPVGLLHFVKVQLEFTKLIGRKADITIPDALHPQLRDRIIGEAIRAA